jgi:hypothetical protein
VARSPDDPRPFSASGYAVFDEDFGDTGRVVIWSSTLQTPRLGDRFNIECLGALHDLAVDEIRTYAGGWSVTCRADEP